MACRNPIEDLTVCASVEDQVISFFSTESGSVGALPDLFLDLTDSGEWCFTVAPNLQITVDDNGTTGSGAVVIYVNVTVIVTVTSEAGDSNTYTRTLTTFSRPDGSGLNGANFSVLSPSWGSGLARGKYHISTSVRLLAQQQVVSISGSVHATASVARKFA
jgi:hypothetical protein